MWSHRAYTPRSRAAAAFLCSVPLPHASLPRLLAARFLPFGPLVCVHSTWACRGRCGFACGGRARWATSRSPQALRRCSRSYPPCAASSWARCASALDVRLMLSGPLACLLARLYCSPLDILGWFFWRRALGRLEANEPPLLDRPRARGAALAAKRPRAADHSPLWHISRGSNSGCCCGRGLAWASLFSAVVVGLPLLAHGLLG